MSIRVHVDPTNPGQIFACCGLLELSDRLWGGAEGAFSVSGDEFSINHKGNQKGSSSERDADELRSKLAGCEITSTMTDGQIARLKKLLNQEKRSLQLEDVLEKQQLSELWNCERLHFHEPFNLWIDWWRDERAGGSNFKTWAGKQFVLDLVRGMQAPMRLEPWPSIPASQWLSEFANDGSLPLYFDADVGSQSSSLDVGFSMDALSMRSRTRPMIELAAFIGLQRFRPLPGKGEVYLYAQWTELLPPILAATACCGRLPQQSARSFEFRLLYRTKYLKSFLTAHPVRRFDQ